MSRKLTKDKLALISTGVCKKILVDYTRLLYESRGMYMVDADIEFPIIVDEYIRQLENIYKKEIGPEEKVHHIDLEDSIKEIKAEKKGCQHLNIKSDGGGDYCNKCGKRWNR